MPKFNGTLMNFYVAAVTDPDTDAQAQPGYTAVSTDYTRVGSTKGLSIPRTRATIDLSDKDSGLDTDAVAGRRNITISAPMNLHDDQEAGQTLITNAVNSDRGELYWLATQDTTGTTQYWGKLAVTNADLDFPEEGAAMMNFTGQVIGAQSEGQVT